MTFSATRKSARFTTSLASILTRLTRRRQRLRPAAIMPIQAERRAGMKFRLTLVGSISLIFQRTWAAQEQAVPNPAAGAVSATFFPAYSTVKTASAGLFLEPILNIR